ncbi:MAG: 30S ribosomal protein S6 [Candidatus Pacebacteria bacterium]|nr:30S ribosomal protein S6 [Candidatus Paceibacterota bacterium]
MNHNENTEPRVYELGYHLVPTLSEEQVPGASKAVRGMIDGISKDIIAEEAPVFIDLAYQVVKTINHKNKRFDDAYFGFIKFEASPEDIAKLEEGLKKDENVLRYLIVKTLRENTFISKKFPSSNAKNREEEVAPVEEAPASEVAETEEEKEPKNPIDDMDKAIDKLVA